MELVKTRLQVFPKQGSYRNFVTASYNVVKSEGIRGLFGGSSAALIASSGSWGFYFLFYEAQKSFLEKKYGELTNTHYVSINFVFFLLYFLLSSLFFHYSIDFECHCSWCSMCFNIQSYMGC